MSVGSLVLVSPVVESKAGAGWEEVLWTVLRSTPPNVRAGEKGEEAKRKQCHAINIIWTACALTYITHKHNGRKCCKYLHDVFIQKKYGHFELLAWCEVVFSIMVKEGRE